MKNELLAKFMEELAQKNTCTDVTEQLKRLNKTLDKISDSLQKSEHHLKLIRFNM